MAATLIGKQRTWGGERDDEGHRTYTIVWLVEAAFTDGPKVVMDCPGLPAPGAIWNFDSDYDPWAFCWPGIKVSIHQEREGDKNKYWKVEQKFSSKPFKRCQNTQIEDPLLEPQKVSGSFVKYTKEAQFDRFGRPLRMSSHEPMRGQMVEFDESRPTVHIEQNRSTLELALISQMINTVNDATLWGLPKRCIKLSQVSWERKYYGTCSVYYTRSFDFDINFETFDRDILDEGTKALNGHWDPSTGWWQLDRIGSGGGEPNPNNPQHFNQYKDRNGENARVILDGSGRPADSIIEDAGTGTSLDVSGQAYYHHVQYYPEMNFLLLNIPTSF